MSSPEPLRVLHVLGGLTRAGVETWLLRVLRNTPPGAWTTEFLLHRVAPGAYDAQARALGAVLRYCPAPSHPLSYARRLLRILQTCGPYDVVHSHVHFYSGVVLRVAAQAGVPIRIAHSHTAAGAPRPAYGAFMRRLLRANATHMLAASPEAAAALFGGKWCTDPRVRIHNYGVDFAPFAELPEPAVLKQRLGVPAERLVIGHVGRFTEQKNHAFLIATFAELVRSGLDVQLLLLGAGPLENAVRAQAAELAVLERCTFGGTHDDLTPFYGAMDLFVFPSRWEGLAMVTLEAQAAGVPVLASLAMPDNAAVIPGLFERIPLEEGPLVWAWRADQLLRRKPAFSRRQCARLMAESPFTIAHSVQELGRIYESARSLTHRRAAALLSV